MRFPMKKTGEFETIKDLPLDAAAGQEMTKTLN